MKKLTFREVIANIKADEVWESGSLIVYLRGNILNIDWKNGYEDVGVNICFNEKFKLQRNKVSFKQAFKAFEEGKEIESCVSGYCFINKHKENLAVKNDDSHTYFEMDPMFAFEEIKGEWYIN